MSPHLGQPEQWQGFSPPRRSGFRASGAFPSSRDRERPPRVRRITRWVDGNQPLLFIANPVNEELRTTVTVPNTGGGLVAWDPVTLSQSALTRSEGGEGFDVRLPPLMGRSSFSEEKRIHIPKTNGLQRPPVSGRSPSPGSNPVPLAHASYWTDPGIGAEYFSGTATYVVEFQLGGPRTPARHPVRRCC